MNIKSTTIALGAVICLLLSFSSKASHQHYRPDSLELTIYSYSQHCSLKFSQRNSKVHEFTIHADIGGDVLLKAPIIGENNFYKWSGPNGFTAYSSEILLRNVGLKQNGVFEIEINQNGNIVYAKVILDIK